MKIKEKKNLYVQPDCQVIQVKVESIIATSGESGSTEEYSLGETNDWFNQ